MQTCQFKSVKLPFGVWHFNIYVQLGQDRDFKMYYVLHIYEKTMFLITSEPKINYVGNELSLNNVHM